MGIKRCCRPGCDEVMCDRLLFGSHYLCGDCFKELREWKRYTWPTTMTKHDVRARIEKFMTTPKGSQIQLLREGDVDRVFDLITGGAEG